MSEIAITALKEDYMRMVKNKPQKYNPDMNSILDENEIKVLMDETGVEAEEELLAPGAKTPQNENSERVQIKEENDSIFALTPEGCKDDNKMQDLLEQYKSEVDFHSGDKFVAKFLTVFGSAVVTGIVGIFAPDRKSLPFVEVATLAGGIVGGFALINKIFKNRDIKRKEKYENLMTERAVQIRKEQEQKQIIAEQKEAAHNANRQRLLAELNINENELEDRWPNLIIPTDKNRSILYTRGSKLESEMTSDEAHDLCRFYQADIDDNGILNEFEIIRCLVKEQNGTLTEEELLKETLDAYTYYSANISKLDNEQKVTTRIALIKQYRELLNNPERLKTFIENEKINSDKRIEIAMHDKNRQMLKPVDDEPGIIVINTHGTVNGTNQKTEKKKQKKQADKPQQKQDNSGYDPHGDPLWWMMFWNTMLK